MKSAVILAGLLALAACQPEEDRAPFAGGCLTDCPRTPVPTRPVGGSSMPQAGAGGAGSGGASSAGNGGAALTLRGSVVEWLDATFDRAQDLAELASVRATAAGGTIVQAPWDGANTFVLGGFSVANPTWVSVLPQRATLLETLHPVPTAVTQDLELGVVAADTFDSLLQSLGAAVERDPARAQVVLIFTRTNGTNVQGVSVSGVTAQGVGYQQSGVWSAATSTDISGRAALFNLSAPAFPGTTERVTLGGVANGYVQVRVAAGAVSVLEVPID